MRKSKRLQREVMVCRVEICSLLRIALRCSGSSQLISLNSGEGLDISPETSTHTEHSLCNLVSVKNGFRTIESSLLLFDIQSKQLKNPLISD